jgi:hypothetical protein
MVPPMYNQDFLLVTLFFLARCRRPIAHAAARSALVMLFGNPNFFKARMIGGEIMVDLMVLASPSKFGITRW